MKRFLSIIGVSVLFILGTQQAAAEPTPTIYNADPTSAPTSQPSPEPTANPTIEPTIPLSPTLPFYCLGECLAPPTPTKKPTTPTPTRDPEVTANPTAKPTKKPYVTGKVVATPTTKPKPHADPCKPGNGPKQKKKHKYKDGRDGGGFKTIFKFVFNFGATEDEDEQEVESTTKGKEKPCPPRNDKPKPPKVSPTVAEPTDKPEDPCVESKSVNSTGQDSEVTSQTNDDGLLKMLIEFILMLIELILKFLGLAPPAAHDPC